jgi:hypothetical protein
LRKWRIGVLIMLTIMMIAEFQLLPGFHEPRWPADEIWFVGLVVIWCVCDAVDKITGKSSNLW